MGKSITTKKVLPKKEVQKAKKTSGSIQKKDKKEQKNDLEELK